MVTRWPSLHLGHPPPHPLSLSLSFSLPTFPPFLFFFYSFSPFFPFFFPLSLPLFLPPSFPSFPHSTQLNSMAQFQPQENHNIQVKGDKPQTKTPQTVFSGVWQLWWILPWAPGVSGQARVCSPAKSMLSSPFSECDCEPHGLFWTFHSLCFFFHYLPVLHLFQETWARRYK